MLFTILLLGTNAFAIEEGIVKEGNKVIYDSDTKSWRISNFSSNKEALTRYKSFGESNYSIYYKNEHPILTLSSDFEFIKNGRLFAIDNKNFKYYEIKNKNNTYKMKKLSFNKVKKLVKNTQVIRISDFENNTYKFEEIPTHNKVLIYNNTRKNFEDFDIEVKYGESNKEIRGLIKTSTLDEIKLIEKKIK